MQAAHEKKAGNFFTEVSECAILITKASLSVSNKNDFATSLPPSYLCEEDTITLQHCHSLRPTSVKRTPVHYNTATAEEDTSTLQHCRSLRPTSVKRTPVHYNTAAASVLPL
ncbi:hypothetical protein ElyMa_000430100 [Elysia marginata]|uniref:Uncharacterized protein n=1 Tax=Elysia marginata TaxID=1093978 RepID=A0AAV4FLS8_9GAST|nr:hypothetical protein ElyMa_000430100 [Elysia marginata]